MISAEEAKRIVLAEAKEYKKKKSISSLLNCTGLYLSQDLKAKYASPPFDQSSMDGYVVNCKMGNKVNEFKLINSEIKAGAKKSHPVKEGEAIRIYTGAAVPKGANLVVPQEFVEVDLVKSIIQFPLDTVKNFEFIRLKGEQFKKSEIVLHKGDKLSPAAIAIAATAGAADIQTYAKPMVTVITGGDELCVPGKTLTPGQVFDSNSYMLVSLLQTLDIEVKNIVYLKDNEKKTFEAIAKAMNASDVILISGGISVGKYDFVKSSLDKLKTKTIFYKVKQKPGKPLYFGKHLGTYVFGLPGNPAASLTCFYEYVKPFLEIISGNNKWVEDVKQVKLKNDFHKKTGLTFFLKGKMDIDGVEILGDQESFKLNSFAKANCIVVGKEDATILKAGQLVECHSI